MTDTTTAFTVTLVRALERLGIRHACITPGSRSTPLALAVAGTPGITDWVHLDERSSAFFALGIARTTRRPVLVITTSGTAAAELHPAIVEARYGRVPLIAVTADRPFDLREVGAPQTIDQQGLFGSAALWSHDIEATVDADPSRVVSLAARLVSLAGGDPCGPVHLNVRYREPLVPVADAPGPVAVPEIVRGRRVADPAEIASIGGRLAGRQGVLVVGAQDDPLLPAAAAGFAGAAGWPVVADALSGLRAGRHDRSRVIAAADPLAWTGWLDRMNPAVVVRCGAVPTSKPVWQWLEGHRQVEQVFIEPSGWRDPTASATTVVQADPASTLAGLAAALRGAVPDSWLERWRHADRLASEAIDAALDATPFPNEPAVARSMASALPDDSTLWVGSSMPVRDVDAFFGSTGTPVQIMANRGANGIDGTVSSGLGSAAVSGAPTTILAGDLATLHDLTALATAARLTIPATVVVVHNDGGGIFHFLPQADHPEFERYFGTAHGVDFVAAGRALGVDAEAINDPVRFRQAMGEHPSRPRLLQVRTDRVENVAVHRRIREAVAAAVADL